MHLFCLNLSTSIIFAILVPLVVTYHRIIFGCILTIILRVALWSSAVILVRKKKNGKVFHDPSQTDGGGNNYDFQLKLNPKILMTLNHSLITPKASEGTDIADFERKEQAKDDEKYVGQGVDEMVYVSSSVKIKGLNIASMEISLFKNTSEESNPDTVKDAFECCLFRVGFREISFQVQVQVQLRHKKDGNEKNHIVGKIGDARKDVKVKTEGSTMTIDASLKIESIQLYLIGISDLLSTPKTLYMKMLKFRQECSQDDHVTTKYENWENLCIAVLAKLIPGVNVNKTNAIVSNKTIIIGASEEYLNECQRNLFVSMNFNTFSLRSQIQSTEFLNNSGIGNLPYDPAPTKKLVIATSLSNFEIAIKSFGTQLHSGMDDTSSVNVESLNIIFTLKNILKTPKCISLDIINSLISNEKCNSCTTISMDKSQQKKKINKGGIIYILTGTNQIENLFTNGNDMKNLIVWFKCIKNKKKSRKDEHFMTNRIKKQTLVVDSISGDIGLNTFLSDNTLLVSKRNDINGASISGLKVLINEDAISKGLEATTSFNFHLSRSHTSNSENEEKETNDHFEINFPRLSLLQVGYHLQESKIDTRDKIFIAKGLKLNKSTWNGFDDLVNQNEDNVNTNNILFSKVVSIDTTVESIQMYASLLNFEEIFSTIGRVFIKSKSRDFAKEKGPTPFKRKVIIKRANLSCKSIDIFLSFDLIQPIDLEKDELVKDDTLLVGSVKLVDLVLELSHHKRNLKTCKKVLFKGAVIESFLTFTPHYSLPIYEKNGCRTNHHSLNKRNVKFSVSTPSFHILFEIPLQNIARKKVEEAGQKMEVMIKEIALKEFIDRNGHIEENIIMQSDGTVSISVQSTSVLSQDFKNQSIPTFAKTVKIQINGSSFKILWSSILQWFIKSALKRITGAVNVYQRMISLPQSKVKANKIKKRILSNIFVKFEGTEKPILNLSLILAGGSIIDIRSKNMIVQVIHDINGSWEKPNVSFYAGATSIYLNNSEFSVINLDCLSFKKILTIASDFEVKEYYQKKEFGECGKEIVTSFAGEPLLETNIIELGKMVINIPPLLHLGRVIKDITSTPNAISEGLKTLNFVKKTSHHDGKYQLMNITATIPFLTATFFEAYKSDTKTSIHEKELESVQLPETMFGKRKDPRLLKRWCFHITLVKVNIKRNSPPTVTQMLLNELDEDKSFTHCYGPVIQGGDLNVSVNNLICILHPLTIATPLALIQHLKITGLFFLAGLSPLTKDLIHRETYCIPVKCHHIECNSQDHSTLSCMYGVELQSNSIPVKIYFDINFAVDKISSTYGMVIGNEIPALMEIIQRLIPPPPPLPVQAEAVPLHDEIPLGWWDNLRSLFHGKICFQFSSLSFRWLLDSVSKYSWSVLLTARHVRIVHSVGTAELIMNDVIVSVPGFSYHMIGIDQSEKNQGIFHKLLDIDAFGDHVKRHSLLLVPSLKLEVDFEWIVSYPKESKSYEHHVSYLINPDNLDNASLTHNVDRFSRFRSHGTLLKLKVSLNKTSNFAIWVALRLDVLPWLTHKNNTVVHQQESKNLEGPGPLPIIEGIDVNATVTDLRVGTWFDENFEQTYDDFTIPEQVFSSDCLCLTVPRVQLSSKTNGKIIIKLKGPIQAALLDIVNDSLGDQNPTTAIKKSGTIDNYLLSPFMLIQKECLDNERNSLRSFEWLQSWSQKIKSLDYVVTIENVIILNQALSEVGDSRMKEERDLKGKQIVLSELEIRKQKAPWTVLVVGMKLLWTLEIRYSVMSIVEDLLFAIDFIKVNARGTHQVMVDSKIDKEKLKTEENHCETVDNSVSCKNVPIQNRVSPKSHLAYLLTSSSEDEMDVDKSLVQSTTENTARLASITTDINHTTKILSENCRSLHKSDAQNSDSTSTLDVRLSNTQIQLHSECTDGSVIMAIRSATIEGKKFIKLFAKDADEKSAENLLRRTEYQYILNQMEIYSLDAIEVDTGLQWLQTLDRNSTPTSKYDFDYSLEATNFKIPLILREFEAKDFIPPKFCEKIMDRCAFKTRQECYNPPFDLTREELCEAVNCDNTAIKSSMAMVIIEIVVDELSFLLSSHQFTTTLDLIRNVLLEPPKAPRQRYYRSSLPDKNKTNETKPNNEPNFERSSRSTTNLKEAISRYTNVRKGEREHLKSLAHESLEALEEKQGKSIQPSNRCIKYSLSKAKWKIYSPTFVDDVVINFTGLEGIHDYPADGSMCTNISLEDFYVSSQKPSPDSIVFDDPTTIIKTVLGVKRSPCQRCGLIFVHTNNESNSCLFHTGSFIFISERNQSWSCCKKIREDASGCQSSPHTGIERAIVLRFDNLPRTVDGLVMYKHVEANFFPGVSHVSTEKEFRNL